MALKALPWFPASVRDIRAFRVEQWSDVTTLVRSWFFDRAANTATPSPPPIRS